MQHYNSLYFGPFYAHVIHEYAQIYVALVEFFWLLQAISYIPHFFLDIMVSKFDLIYHKEADESPIYQFSKVSSTKFYLLLYAYS